MPPPLRFGAVYDFRNPASSGRDNASFYAAVMEQVAWLDSIGMDLCWFTEHHFLEDGYLPSWIPVAGALAARTKRIRFSSDICLMPFNHPVRLAEDLAVLDNLSGGRVELGAGMGYAPHEFRGFGIPFPERKSRTEEALEILQRCFTGERFSYRGKRFQLEDVQIRPRYVQPGGPPLWVGAMSEAGARRAARLGTHLLPQGPRQAVLDPWREDMRAAGHDPDAHRIGIIRPSLVTDDPDRDWPPVKAAERYRMGVYLDFARASGGRGGVNEMRDDTRIPQTWIVGNVDTVAAQLATFIREFGITDIVTWAVPPGLRPEQMNASLERYVRDVVPRVKAAIGRAS